eukprot:TRINITY_DN6787_c0_g1_i1.p1 TRINITY_DN6787_c0_g1~~TRINITY_DN6787_c0_g1_i1.p1  ORF type:complete len:1084 (-),score=265.41 TRINITY_DN6787_c0_g1_i1:21-3155(-)
MASYDDHYDYLFKLVLVGNSGVGKSALLARFTRDTFDPSHRSTIGVEFATKTIEVEGKKIKLQIWDTAGQERFRAITSAYYRGSAGVLIVFDLTSRESFHGAKRWLDEVAQHTEKHCERILIGNKSDLEHREISRAEAIAFATQEKLNYIETSAKDNVNVNAAIRYLVTGSAPDNAASTSNICGSHSIPLRRVNSFAKIVDTNMSISIRQEFENVEDFPVEAVIYFPVDSEASVNSFAAVNLKTGAKIQGVIMERERAADKYSDTIAAGKPAYMMEEDSTSDTRKQFKASIGLLAPNERVEVVVSFVSELKLELGRLKFVFPTLVQNSQTNQIGTLPPSIEASLVAEMVMPHNIEKLESPSGHVFTTGGGQLGNSSENQSAENTTKAEATTSAPLGNATTVTVKHLNSVPRDFELYITLDHPLATRGVVAVNKEYGSAAMLAFYPGNDIMSSETKEGQESSAKVLDEEFELTFIIDRSGSMAGSPWNDAKQAIQVFLRSLPLKCHFQIIGFGSKFENIFEQDAELYTEESMRQASDKIKGWRADLGGTELLQPLQYAFEMSQQGEQRRVIVITDGVVNNKEAVLALTARFASTCKTYALGIGNDVDVDLIQGLAQSGDGAYELTGVGESIQSKVVRLLKKALNKYLAEVQVEWTGVEPASFTPEMSTVVLGERITTYALLKNPPNSGEEVSALIRARKWNGEPYELRVPCQVFEDDTTRSTHCLAAKKIIDALEKDDKEKKARNAKNNAPRSNATEYHRDEIVALSKKYGVASEHTSFLAVPAGQAEGTAQEASLVVKQIPFAVQSKGESFSHHSGGEGIFNGTRKRMGSGSAASAPIGIANSRPVVVEEQKASGCCGGPPPKQASAPTGNSGIKIVSGSSSSSSSTVASSNVKPLVSSANSSTNSARSGASAPTTPRGPVPSLTTSSTAASISSHSAPPSAPSRANFDEMVQLQHADGSWTLDDKFARLLGLGKSLDELKRNNTGPNESVWATAIALVWMEKYHTDKRDIWDLIYQKGYDFLNEKKSLNLDATAWMTKAAQLL